MRRTPSKPGLLAWIGLVLSLLSFFPGVWFVGFAATHAVGAALLAVATETSFGLRALGRTRPESRPVFALNALLRTPSLFAGWCYPLIAWHVATGVGAEDTTVGAACAATALPLLAMSFSAWRLADTDPLLTGPRFGDGVDEATGVAIGHGAGAMLDDLAGVVDDLFD
jgi:hypothetical protein